MFRVYRLGFLFWLADLKFNYTKMAEFEAQPYTSDTPDALNSDPWKVNARGVLFGYTGVILGFQWHNENEMETTIL